MNNSPLQNTLLRQTFSISISVKAIDLWSCSLQVHPLSQRQSSVKAGDLFILASSDISGSFPNLIQINEPNIFYIFHQPCQQKTSCDSFARGILYLNRLTYSSNGFTTTSKTITISIVVKVSGCKASASVHFLIASSAQKHEAVHMHHDSASSWPGFA